MGCSIDTLATWEKGKFEPNASKLAALADALGVAIDELFEEQPDVGGRSTPGDGDPDRGAAIPDQRDRSGSR
jgi:transcriptional regulator with XRE-family HTH domain